MKGLSIADLAALPENQSIDGIFLVLSRQQRTTKTGKPYLSLTLGDCTGQIESRIWDPSHPDVSTPFERGDVLKVRAIASRFDGSLQLKIERLRLATATEYDRSELLPATTQDVALMWQNLLQVIDSIESPHLRRLLHALLDDPQMQQAYQQAPAARQLHHAWLGGLLEHVVSLLGLARRVVPHYPIVSPDLVYTGILLHDIGKIHELSWQTGFEYTTEGQLLGHIPIGISMVERAIDSIPDFPPRLRTIVLHLILSHHGRLEFGSPKLPMIPEALMLNFLDDLDAKMQTIATEFQKAARQGRPAHEMTDRIWALDQRTMLDTRSWLAQAEND